MKRGFVGIALVLFALAAAFSQPKPAFEVASIKRHVIVGRRGRADAPITTIDPAMLSMSVISAGGLIDFAYDSKSSQQIEGKPSWLYLEFYNVVAKCSRPATKDQQRVMMQTLLADRFRLACHRETREGPVYALVPGKKLKVTPAAGPETPEFNPHPVHTLRGDDVIFTYTGKNVSMAQMANWLWSRFARPVVDKTGIRGTVDFTLAVTADQAMGVQDFISAVQDQLGLKVESQRGPIEFLVIDHIERASED